VDANSDNVVIVEGILKGDKSAENAFASKYLKTLRFIISQRCENRELADDIVQETLALVLQRCREGKIEKPEALSSYVRSTGINLLIAHFRKENRRATDPIGNEDLPFIQDLNPELVEQVEQKQHLALVMQLLEELPVERDRELIKAYFLGEQNKLSLCDRFDISAEHFDRVLYRARNRLKQKLSLVLGGKSVFD